MATKVQTSETKKIRKGARKLKSASSRGTSKGRGLTARRMANSLHAQGRTVMSGAYDQVMRAGRAIPKMAGGIHPVQRATAFSALIEERPLVLCAMGAGIGMVVAAILPPMMRHR